jgi:hypothetical protein
LAITTAAAVGLDEHVFLALAIRAELPHDQGHGPGGLVVRERRGEPPLGQPDGVAVDRDLDRRVTRLEDPGVHDPADGLAARLFQGIPQVVRLGVRVGVRGQVSPDPVAEHVRTEPLLDHPQDRAALRVRERVEHAARVVR